MSGDFDRAFAALQPVWDDCTVGVVVVEHASAGGPDAVAAVIADRGPFLFFPWLRDGHEDLTLPAQGLREHDVATARGLFIAMAQDAIRHGSPDRVDEGVLGALFDAFVAGFSSPRFFVNFSSSSWRPVTGHTRDSLLVVVDTARVGMWLSCDDE